MPGNIRVVEVKLTEAETLADFYGILFDLDNASQLCNRAIEFSQQKNQDYLLVEGLVVAALVRYNRCFSSGSRRGLHRKDIEPLDEDALAAHDYYKALRDKFVAHSVNPFEETYVTATARERDGVRFPVESVAPGQHRVVLWTGDAKALIRLIASVRAIVERKLKIEEQRLLAVIRSLPVDTIHAWDLHQPRRFNAEDVYKSRARSRAPKDPFRGRAHT